LNSSVLAIADWGFLLSTFLEQFTTLLRIHLSPRSRASVSHSASFHFSISSIG
jgi:hypothetical protein